MAAEALQRAVDLGAQLPEVPGATGTVALSLPGHPGGDVVVAAAWVDGRPVEVLDDPPAAPALTLTLPAEEAEAVARGRLTPSVAYMQGRLKTAGDNRLLLAVLAATATPAFARWRSGLGPG
ncbi:MAG: SCP2 sterol-binding domain-containing protein [Acidimicrobiales bacterium]